jgi:hypothetical protein
MHQKYIQQKIKHFLNNTQIKNFLDTCSNTNLGKKHKNLALLFSFNIQKDEIVASKLYFELYRLFRPSEISKFLPVTKDFLKLQLYWNKNLDSSLCFGIKEINGKIVHYFHIKTDKVYNRGILPATSCFNKHNIGISYEYGDGKAVRKIYAYLTEKKDINKFLHENGSQYDTDMLDHIEYTETSDGTKKYILVNDLNKYPKISKVVFPQNTHDAIDYMEQYGAQPVFYGHYLDKDITSLYFSFTKNRDNFNTFYNSHASK